MTPSFVAELFALSGISAEFGYLVDQGRASECAELFAADARLVFGAGSPKPGTIEGLDAVRHFLAARQAQTHVTTRHQATNFRMRWNGGTEAMLDSLLTVFRSDDATREPVVTVVADVHEVFTREVQGKWLIRERQTTPVFVRTLL